MTLAEKVSREYSRRSQHLTLGPTFLVILLSVMMMSGLNVADPMIRHDDYPALFADAPAFWNKTLHEGRWLNYMWHLRDAVTPAWLNFAVYQTSWALFVAALAVVFTGPKGANWFTVVLALLMMVSPSAMLISMWFNTLIPGLAIVALFAGLACRVSSRTLRLLLPGFVIVSFMAYTTYPLLLFAVCIAKTENRSLQDLVGLILLFCASFALAVLTVYAINWQVHGVFGVPVANWREPTAANGLGDIVASLPKLWETFQIVFHRNGFGFAPLIGFIPVMLAAAFAVFYKYARLEGLYLIAGLSVGIALVVVQVLKLGVIVPPRAFIFAWVFAAMAMVRAVELLSQTESWAGRMGRNAILLIVGVYFIEIFMFYGQHNAWRADTKQLAQEISDTDGSVFIYGDSSQIASAKKSGIQSSKALPFRLQQLTGRRAVNCIETPDQCPKQPQVIDADTNEIHVRRTNEGLFMIFTPSEDTSPSEPL
ncbi:MAG TPA: hypothetical protein ENI28_07660 [Roseobacter sp.]|nr:hypothetical protein [Roseobacter sp.]